MSLFRNCLSCLVTSHEQQQVQELISRKRVVVNRGRRRKFFRQRVPHHEEAQKFGCDVLGYSGPTTDLEVVMRVDLVHTGEEGPENGRDRFFCTGPAFVQEELGWVRSLGRVAIDLTQEPASKAGRRWILSHRSGWTLHCTGRHDQAAVLGLLKRLDPQDDHHDGPVDVKVHIFLA